jgi:hypothetical protein
MGFVPSLPLISVFLKAIQHFSLLSRVPSAAQTKSRYFNGEIPGKKHQAGRPFAYAPQLQITAPST